MYKIKIIWNIIFALIIIFVGSIIGYNIYNSIIIPKNNSIKLNKRINAQFKYNIQTTDTFLIYNYYTNEYNISNNCVVFNNMNICGNYIIIKQN